MPAYTSVIVTRLIVVYGTEANIRNMSRNDGRSQTKICALQASTRVATNNYACLQTVTFQMVL